MCFFQQLQKINDACMTAFLLLPQYCLGRGLLDMKISHYFYLGEKFAFGIIFVVFYFIFFVFIIFLGKAEVPDPFRWKFLGRNLLCMFIQGILAFSLVLLIEYRQRHRRK